VHFRLGPPVHHFLLIVNIDSSTQSANAVLHKVEVDSDSGTPVVSRVQEICGNFWIRSDVSRFRIVHLKLRTSLFQQEDSRTGRPGIVSPAFAASKKVGPHHAPFSNFSAIDLD